jgi:hypothetical protein
VKEIAPAAPVLFFICVLMELCYAERESNKKGKLLDLK